jgi:hypothetical protein
MSGVGIANGSGGTEVATATSTLEANEDILSDRSSEYDSLTIASSFLSTGKMNLTTIKATNTVRF